MAVNGGGIWDGERNNRAVDDADEEGWVMLVGMSEEEEEGCC